jgi:hypothetical protein
MQASRAEQTWEKLRSQKSNADHLRSLKGSAAVWSEPQHSVLFISNLSPSAVDIEIKPPQITLTKKRKPAISEERGVHHERSKGKATAEEFPYSQKATCLV